MAWWLDGDGEDEANSEAGRIRMAGPTGPRNR